MKDLIKRSLIAMFIAAGGFSLVACGNDGAPVTDEKPQEATELAQSDDPYRQPDSELDGLREAASIDGQVIDNLDAALTIFSKSTDVAGFLSDSGQWIDAVKQYNAGGLEAGVKVALLPSEVWSAASPCLRQLNTNWLGFYNKAAAADVDYINSGRTEAELVSLSSELDRCSTILAAKYYSLSPSGNWRNA